MEKGRRGCLGGEEEDGGKKGNKEKFTTSF